jgi:hypothetical protein
LSACETCDRMLETLMNVQYYLKANKDMKVGREHVDNLIHNCLKILAAGQLSKTSGGDLLKE